MTPAFPRIESIPYEGPGSTSPLAFKHYNADVIIEGKPTKEHLRFSVVYWHAMRGKAASMFGWGIAQRPWGRITHRSLYFTSPADEPPRAG